MSTTDPIITRDSVLETLIALCPRGRAWQTHDAATRDSVIRSFWYAIAGPWLEMEQKVTAALEEFFCATFLEDEDAWFEEYGLPNLCSPFGDDICAFVGASGGTSAEYYQGIADSLGWSTEIRWLTGEDFEYPGVRATLLVKVDVEASVQVSPPAVGEVILGVDRLGSGDRDALRCALETIVPAHAVILYDVTGGTRGSELVSNGSFASDTVWTKGTGWTIGSGVATRTNVGSVSALLQSITVTPSVLYEVTYTITAITSGSIKARFTGGSAVNGVERSSAGTFSETLVPLPGNTTLRFQASEDFAGSIDDVSVREIIF